MNVNWIHLDKERGQKYEQTMITLTTKQYINSGGGGGGGGSGSNSSSSYNSRSNNNNTD